MLRPERLRQVPEQFSWVDQALVQRHFIDRCDARAAALYLFLVTVSDAQGLSYYGETTLTARLRLSTEELDVARQQLLQIELIAYQAPLYRYSHFLEARRPLDHGHPHPHRRRCAIPDNGRARLAQILDQMGRRRAQL